MGIAPGVAHGETQVASVRRIIAGERWRRPPPSNDLAARVVRMIWLDLEENAAII